MKVKDMIAMLELADKDSDVVLEIRDKDINLIGYFDIGSDHHETGGYNPDELEHFEWLKEPKVMLMSNSLSIMMSGEN